MPISEDVQSLSPGTIIEMFELNINDTIVRWHNGTNEISSSITWSGDLYTRLPVESSGFETKANGTIPRPTIRVANITGEMSALAKANNDLIGSLVTRKKTMLRYLDAVNFEGGVNPDADSSAEFPQEIYTIDRKATENGVFIEFELVAAFDLAGVALPRRQVIQNVCNWAYRSTECSFTGGAIADINDVATTVLADDVCGKRLTSCKLRFGEFGTLPFGGFPGAGLIK